MIDDQEPAYLLQSQCARLGKFGQVTWTPLSLARPPLRTPLSLSRTSVTLVFHGACTNRQGVLVHMSVALVALYSAGSL